MFGSEHDRFRELSDWLQAFTSDLSSRLDSVRPEVLTGTGSWAGAASNPLLAVLDRFDASGSALVEVLRSLAETLRQATLNLAAHDNFAAMSMFGS